MSEGRAGYMVGLNSRLCCASLPSEPHAPSCRIVLDGKASPDQAVMRVLAVCDEWDLLTKGESPTTARIRRAIFGEPDGSAH
jgi:hypothetical protein